MCGVSWLYTCTSVKNKHCNVTTEHKGGEKTENVYTR